MSHPALLAPSEANETAPDSFSVTLETTKGPIIIDLDRSLAPIGVDRFYNLVRIGFFADLAFFRVVERFVAQAGISGDPATSKIWSRALLQDDPVKGSNTEGTVTFATSGKNARTTQFFVNMRNNARLDAMGFAPIGRVQDMSVVSALHSGYGEAAPGGDGPMQGRLRREGSAYLRAEFPELDFIRSAEVA